MPKPRAGVVRRAQAGRSWPHAPPTSLRLSSTNRREAFKQFEVPESRQCSFWLSAGIGHCAYKSWAKSAAGRQIKSLRPEFDGSRGKRSRRIQYIVNNVAVCGQCHTPRNAMGEPDRSKSLEG